MSGTPSVRISVRWRPALSSDETLGGVLGTQVAHVDFHEGIALLE